MRPLFTAAWACLLARASCSWVFASGLEDGDYTVTLPWDSSASAAAVVTKRGSLPPPPGDIDMFTDPEPPLPPLRNSSYPDHIPLPKSKYFCRYDTFPFAPRAYLEARQHFQAYCEMYLVPDRTIHISVARNGSLGIFACNLAENPQPCSEREYKWAEDKILDPHCGDLVSGQVEMQRWLKWYGRAYPGDMLCPPQIKQPLVHLKKQVWEGMPKFIPRPPVVHDKPVVENPVVDKPAGDGPADGDFPSDDFPSDDFPDDHGPGP
ncbi:hypothetical protein HRG_001772 [Hirsutella rhossiliensis]|uniref:Uncharacterized protein n=1 Tax=Hirsutella rhossiliensis TaxID=111463 RepID=A0A9P8SKG8_9HYPO|nr:uncharacterized protein HRG_01772 [Hirsutella rhossiliensis]KAH0966363.1 hypothetical protein HRG_01772 [Hirsutella rhossiliensis]